MSEHVIGCNAPQVVPAHDLEHEPSVGRKGGGAAGGLMYGGGGLGVGLGSQQLPQPHVNGRLPEERVSHAIVTKSAQVWPA